MKARLGLATVVAGVTVGLGGFVAPGSRVEAVVGGAGVATLQTPPNLPCGYEVQPFFVLPCPLKKWLYYRDIGGTNNNVTVKMSVREKLNVVDPGFVIVGGSAACSGVGEVTCDFRPYNALVIETGGGDDVVTLKQSTTTVRRVDCGPGYDKLFKGNARLYGAANCEEIA